MNSFLSSADIRLSLDFSGSIRTVTNLSIYNRENYILISKNEQQDKRARIYRSSEYGAI